MDDSLVRELADLSALQRLGSLNTEYLPQLAGDLRPAALVAVMDEVVLGARTVLVELGCGSSSVLLARLLQQRGFGHLLSIEHDERTAAFVASQLRREGLGSAARVVHAPLSRHPAALSRHGQWYAPQQVHDEVLGYVERFGLVDLLLVDGPGFGDSRYPALPVLSAVLAPGATVLADDADRPDEQAVLTRWSEEFGLEFRTAPRTSLAVATGLA
ncbi:class I SAM-dependent methyltransferase [Lentzea flaviverrucosa]|uniref:Methyltransferase domain-containing protein n=1 Tax=Lentzea flaviverrucosa TaxID=200379 RepID=A0A1H9XWI2_9PSEU|nr:class I SAM-dependent methyltransferase [Lentzea flaviverrucosa]RDI18677.1 methyltransferase family protein [Lentzea flaviverrucosa]SES50107.1 Methyltransferase domain-containing protein [Lentzea flaviverrucosa]